MLGFTLPFTATRLHASTYLFGVALFSISFLVFLNSAVSFVITDRIGQKDRVGDAVGTLGFADELVVVFACPIWGVLSDRVGLRVVTVAGYTIIGISLFVFVQAQNVYPQLLLGRMFFAIGAAATSTMVTAILPTMTYQAARAQLAIPSPLRSNGGPSHGVAASISSEMTITPTRFQARSQDTTDSEQEDSGKSTSQLSGLVGMFTGLGALLALGLFLPLPTRFQKAGVSPSEAIADSFYVVGAFALAVGTLCSLGLRNLPGEAGKSWRSLIPSHSQRQYEEGPTHSLSYAKLLGNAVSLGMQDSNIGLGYIGGFVARASSVAISLFIPLFVNQYFLRSGRCPTDPDASPLDPGEAKRNCQRAYIVASILTGVSQLIALLCAPVFGYLNAHYSKSKLPLLVAAAAGVGGYSAFGALQEPDPTGEHGNAGVFIIVALLGISQIGAIVSSLDLIGRGISTKEHLTKQSTAHSTSATARNTASRATNGLRRIDDEPSVSDGDVTKPHEVQRESLKGSVAGIYSLSGGVGILLLTKVGGLLFDRVDPGSPFFMMAGFNALLFALTLMFTCIQTVRSTNPEPEAESLLATQHEVDE